MGRVDDRGPVQGRPERSQGQVRRAAPEPVPAKEPAKPAARPFRVGSVAAVPEGTRPVPGGPSGEACCPPPAQRAFQDMAPGHGRGRVAAPPVQGPQAEAPLGGSLKVGNGAEPAGRPVDMPMAGPGVADDGRTVPGPATEGHAGTPGDLPGDPRGEAPAQALAADAGRTPADGDVPDAHGAHREGVSDGTSDEGVSGNGRAEAALGTSHDGPAGAPAEGGVEGRVRDAAKKVAGKAAEGGVGAVAPTLALMQVASTVKKTFVSLLSTAVGAVQNLVSGGVVGLVQSVAGAVVGLFTSIGAFLSGLGASGAVVGATVACVAVVGSVAVFSPQQADDGDPCALVADVAANRAAQDSVTGDEDVVVEGEEAYREIVDELAGILKGQGLSDNAIAGIVGNVAAECGFDFSQVEGIYDEWGAPGPKKTGALSDIDVYTRGLFASYASSGLSINRDAYLSEADGNYWPALGFCSWTGGQAYRLYSRAQAAGADWWDRDFQIAYWLAYGNNETTGRGGFANGTEFLADYASWCEGKTVAECVSRYVDVFHGQTMSNRGDVRLEAADRWLPAIAGAQPRSMSTEAQGFYTSIVSSMGQDAASSSVASAVRDNPAVERCTPQGKDLGKGAASIARAAASWAWPSKEQAYNDGTEAYRRAHDEVHGPGANYKDCGIAVATAVRKSGADLDYPLADTTANQLPYLRSSSKWEKVCDFDEADKVGLLRPGDVLIADKTAADGHDMGCGHTAVFTGGGLLSSIDGVDPAFDMVQASLNTYSPAAASTASLLSDARSYEAYRCVAPDNGGAGEGVSGGTDGQALAGASQAQRRIVDAARSVPSPGAGYCAMWVSQVYQAAGLGYVSGNACDQYAQWCTSTNLDELKVGMIVAVPSHPHTAAGSVYGHVGVYVGDGLVMHNTGTIDTTNILQWVGYYGATQTPRWGFATTRSIG